MRKKIEEIIARVLMGGSTCLVAGTLLLIIGSIAVKGFGALNLAMITQTPGGGYYLGKEGGVLNAIVGSLLLAGAATLASMLVSVPVALYLNVCARRKSRSAEIARMSLDVLLGVPSIVYGAFGFVIMLYFGLKASLLAGIITVSLLILPMMIRGMDEVIRMVPKEMMEASYSLGATRVETAFKIVTRQALPGIMSAVLLSFGRGIGDAASVLFTAGFSDRIPHSLLEPAATLPLAIFFQLGTPFPEVQQRAYASALILTAVILVVSLSARLLAHRYGKNVIR